MTAGDSELGLVDQIAAALAAAWPNAEERAAEAEAFLADVGLLLAQGEAVARQVVDAQPWLIPASRACADLLAARAGGRLADAAESWLRAQ